MPASTYSPAVARFFHACCARLIGALICSALLAALSSLSCIACPERLRGLRPDASAATWRQNSVNHIK
ncbi:hypothetical protein D3C85_264090 [compost metagenome]